MEFWQSRIIQTGLALVVLLIIGELARAAAARFSGSSKAGIPASILAGAIGLLLGPEVIGLVDLDRQVLETVVYFGLGVVFIAVGLKEPAAGKAEARAGIKSFALGVPVMISVQLGIGIALVMALRTVGSDVHPGVGVMLPLGFEEGPGQALALGSVWEDQNGMAAGRQIGLIVAAVGFAWAVVIGVPMVIWGQRRGLLAKHAHEALEGQTSASAPDSMVTHEPTLAAGSLDILTRQVVAIGLCLLLTYFVCFGLSSALASMPDIAAVIWGFHFIIGAIIAMMLRPLLKRLPQGTPLHDPTLTKLSGIGVDVMTCSAIAAIEIAVFRDHLLPIMLITTVGGIVTLLMCLWFSSRAFPDAPFEHAVVWFGTSTGTLPMGLALLRIVDPHFKTTAPISAVLGSAASVPLGAIALMVLVPASVSTFPEHYPGAGWLFALAAFAFAAVIVLAWARFAGLKLTTAPMKLWYTPPSDSAD